MTVTLLRAQVDKVVALMDVNQAVSVWFANDNTGMAIAKVSNGNAWNKYAINRFGEALEIERGSDHAY